MDGNCGRFLGPCARSGFEDLAAIGGLFCERIPCNGNDVGPNVDASVCGLSWDWAAVARDVHSAWRHCCTCWVSYSVAASNALTSGEVSMHRDLLHPIPASIYPTIIHFVCELQPLAFWGGHGGRDPGLSKSNWRGRAGAGTGSARNGHPVVLLW